MDDRNERIAAALDRVFRTYRQSDRGEPDDVLRERLEMAKVYFEAVDRYDVVDIEAAAKEFVAGTVPGANPNYVPPAPVVGAECRRQMNLRLEGERRRKPYVPTLPPPRPDKDSRARVKALIDGCVANISTKALDGNPESERGRASIFEQTNRRFDDERGFDVGDPEGAEDAA